MKRTFTILLGVLLLAASATVQADYQYGHFYYIINSPNPNTATITGYSGPPWAVAIPDFVNGLLVTSIADQAFLESRLTSVTIPNSVTYIGFDAFEFCLNLTNAIIDSGSGPTSIEDGAFLNDYSLSDVTIGNGVTSIGDNAFYYCTNLTIVRIPSSVTSIGLYAFEFCFSLTNATFNSPSGLTSIGTGAFGDCTNLANVTIPSSVTSIGEGSFYYCALTDVTIPASVTSIGPYAFEFCTNLANVCFQGNEPSDGGNIFNYDPVSIIFYVNGTTGWGSRYIFSGLNTAPCTQCAGAQTLGVPSFSGLTPSQSILYGTNDITLAGTLSAGVAIYPAQGETITVTINGNPQTTETIDSTGDFSFSYNPSTIPSNATPYTITYSYAGDAWLNPATDTSTKLVVSTQGSSGYYYYITKIAAGGYDSLFLKSDGSLWGMGFNDLGQLGDGTYNNADLPEQIVASNVTAIAAGAYHSLFLKSDGSLWAMGDNSAGQLGDGTTDNGTYETNRPEQIVAGNVTAIAVGDNHSLFLKSDGSLWGMGLNAAGQLGDGTYNNADLPEQIVAGGVTAISAGGSSSLFLKSDGSLWAMGFNGFGELGDGTYNNVDLPEQIVAGGVTAIAAGDSDSLFLKSDGSLWAMGWNASGQLGDGTYNTADLPEQIVAGGVTAIAAGAVDSLFLKSDSSLWAMGDNSSGELGDGTTDNGTYQTNQPEQIVSSGVVAIAAGAFHGLFLKSDGSLWGMGDNEFGQLGDGTNNNADRPKEIVVGTGTRPVAGTFMLGAVEGTPVSVPVAKILSVATSANPSPTFSLTSVTSPTANGATVVLTAGGTMLTYTPAANYVGADTINYVLSDGSGTAAAVVTVTVASGNAPSQNGLTIQMSGNNAILQFHGVPGQAYYVQQSSSINGPWQDLPGTPVTANSLGLIAYTVTAPPTPSYYRTSINP